VNVIDNVANVIDGVVNVIDDVMNVIDDVVNVIDGVVNVIDRVANVIDGYLERHEDVANVIDGVAIDIENVYTVAVSIPKRDASKDVMVQRHRTALRKSAATPRRGWIRPLRRMRRATKACLGWIDCSCRVLEESSRIGTQRPFATTVQLLRVSRWLAAAAAHLQRAEIRLQDTQQSLALAPEEGRGAPEMVIAATQQWVAATSRLLAAQDRLEVLMAEVLRSAQEGAVDPRPVLPTRRPAAARWFLRYCPLPPSNRIRILLQRRRRPACTAPADAPRRVSRGRAPPFVSTCPL